MAENRELLNQEERKFCHIDRCTAGPGVRLDTGPGTLYEGCLCEDENCASIECSCTCAYDARGLLKEEYFAAISKPVFECNSKCSCASTCPNRVTQNPPLSSLQIFETDPKAKGLGVRSSHNISQGTFVAEYVGEIISKSDAKQRLDALSPSDSCYIVTYREHTGSGTVLRTNIDAMFAGNITRDITLGQELCFSYFGCSSVDLLDRDAVHLGKKVCLCGSQNCLQFLPLQN